jgi:membrane protease YdiL (CAAX protease family)
MSDRTDIDPPANLPPSIEKDSPSWLRPELVASWREIIAVLAIFIGPFTWKSTWAIWHGSDKQYLNYFGSDYRLLINGAVEGVLLALFLSWLHWRGWNKTDFKIRPTWWSSVQAFFLLIAVQLGNVLVVLGLIILLFSLQPHGTQFLTYVADHNPKINLHNFHIRWATIVGTMTLNAFFEELICMGYAFNQFAAKLGTALALFLTVLLRMSCHTYQGPTHVMGIGVVFLIFGLWYWRTRNLWTLIFAHALLDTISIGLLKLLH